MESIGDNRSVAKEAGVAGVETLDPVAGGIGSETRVSVSANPRMVIVSAVVPGMTLQDEDALLLALYHLAPCPRVGQRGDGPA